MPNESKTSRTASIEVVRAMVSFALHQGWPVDEMLARARLDPILLAEGRARVTEDQIVTMLRHLWRDTDDELLGLGRFPLPRGTFRLLCYGVIDSRDLGEGLERMRSFLDAVPALSLQITVDREAEQVTIVVPAWTPPGVEDPHHLISLAELIAMHRVVTWGAGSRVPGLRLGIPSEAPWSAEVLEALLGAVEIDRTDGGTSLGFSTEALRLPMVRTHRELDDFISAAPRSFFDLPVDHDAVRPRVRGMLDTAARSGDWPTARKVAQRLAVSEQTLRRRLSDEGTSFREVLEEVRRDAAVTGLVRGETVADLAHRLGYSESSAFTRAFVRWTGSTPGAYRRRP